jgi:hypothetical protein
MGAIAGPLLRRHGSIPSGRVTGSSMDGSKGEEKGGQRHSGGAGKTGQLSMQFIKLSIPFSAECLKE